ncbi:helix-turn-helix domain-containing protein [Demetria terragena]|uniref:helix-turn-helix domain-containing protein n=1 Tax=Demetria terragena TaxID=63959 RepID=UPI00039A96B7|nr:helix-turn-helix transcriptional regulator [Demetria terragena]
MTVHAGPEALRWLREVSGLTQRRLAELSGVSERTIRGLERGQVATPHQASLHALVDAAELDSLQTATFLRAWAPDRVRSLTELSRKLSSVEDVVAEIILQNDVEEHLITCWTRYVVRNEMVRSYTTRVVLEANSDRVDTYVIPFAYQVHEEPPRIAITTTGASVQQRHHFADIGVIVYELHLNRTLMRGESGAFEFTVTLENYPPPEFSDPTEWFMRLTHRVTPLVVLEVQFESPPDELWVVDLDENGARRKVRTIEVDRHGRAHYVVRDVRAGANGFEWTFPLPSAS